jgi:rubrerythrin
MDSKEEKHKSLVRRSLVRLHVKDVATLSDPDIQTIVVNTCTRCGHQSVDKDEVNCPACGTKYPYIYTKEPE